MVKHYPNHRSRGYFSLPNMLVKGSPTDFFHERINDVDVPCKRTIILRSGETLSGVIDVVETVCLVEQGGLCQSRFYSKTFSFTSGRIVYGEKIEKRKPLNHAYLVPIDSNVSFLHSIALDAYEDLTELKIPDDMGEWPV